jgi:hypothetical protein
MGHHVNLALPALIQFALRAPQAVGSDSLVRTVLAALTDAERQVVRAVRAHLAELDPPATEPTVVLGAAPAPVTPAAMLRTLLDTSIANLPQDSRAALYCALLDVMVPDEARILAALSDGTAYPTVDVCEPTLGTSTAIVLANASTVGRAAGVSLPHHTPLYVSRLVRAGLAQLGPEGGPGMYDDYEMLLTDAAVNAAVVRARRGIRSARVLRRTVRISELGWELWEAAT